MLNYQITTIEGNATRDPVIKKTTTGKDVCNFTLAVHHYSKEDDEPKVSYIDVETWDKLAGICSSGISKGKRVMVVGTLRQDRWEGKDGKKQSRIKIIGKEVRLLEYLKKPEAEAVKQAV
jgi:single-strand DNA-binding protein